MDARMMLHAEAFLETARHLTPLQRQIVRHLYEKGPCLLLELAVRLLTFPEEVRQPVQELRALGIIHTEGFAGGKFVAELLSLSPEGREVVHLLNSDAPRQAALADTRRATESVSAPNPRQQEIELLRQLGDLAKQEGKTDEARAWYEEALKIARGVSAEPPSSPTSSSTQ
ncbi:MAG: hypothetical protein FJZ47_14240 [Candidatus Tectomicrobia bacterium]|uniref:Tetratricopeptide repeat protein n=1 Tax=Tectimicrobiota bacterium TaxID=2528274 RepID=A0A937W175_UNCTE|nr:hypothetical protein [Candidatus Tectomicrobia bacterium]